MVLGSTNKNPQRRGEVRPAGRNAERRGDGRKVAEAEPKDLTVTNTVGDLYARLGENDKADEIFQKCPATPMPPRDSPSKPSRCTEVHPKIKSSLESVLGLAEFYTQQGLFNDARAQYLGVAEEFLKAGELEQAVRIFQKSLEMDPDNTRHARRGILHALR